MFYLLHGDDEFTIREQVKRLRQQGNFEYNQDTYNGGEVTLATITAPCDTLPFLSDQQFVVVEGLPEKPRRGNSLPPTGDEDAIKPAASAGKGKKGKKSKK